MNKEKGLQENILSSLRKNKMSCEAVSAKEKWKIQQTWRERFAEGVKSKTGKWVFKNSDWHAFSFNFTPCLRGARAEEAFKQKLANRFFLIASHHNIPAYICSKEGGLNAEIFTELLSNAPDLGDLYILPVDYEWTMVFVHEPNMGPFLAEYKADKS
jgi:hypothetical protein